MGDDDFLSRWSKRKRAVVEEAEEAKPLPVAEPEPQTEDEEADLLARLDLPVPETLQSGDDFSRFMADGVPQFLRRRALKVLWRSNPVLANLDGLNDYDDDFTSPELTQKVLATGYKVGRGFLSALSEEKAEGTPEPKADETVPEPDKPEETIVISSENDPAPKQVSEDAEDAAVQRPRRMRFET